MFIFRCCKFKYVALKSKQITNWLKKAKIVFNVFDYEKQLSKYHANVLLLVGLDFGPLRDTPSPKDPKVHQIKEGGKLQ